MPSTHPSAAKTMPAKFQLSQLGSWNGEACPHLHNPHEKRLTDSGTQGFQRHLKTGPNNIMSSQRKVSPWLKLTWSFAAINRTSRCVTASTENIGLGVLAGVTILRASSRLIEGNVVVQPRSSASLTYSSLWNLSRWPRRPVFEVDVE
jgi:hypothetical protein